MNIHILAVGTEIYRVRSHIHYIEREISKLQQENPIEPI